MRLTLLFLIIAQYGFLQRPEIRINPVGHMSQIRDIEVTSDGKYALSASLDKSIKKWNIETGQLEQEYRGQIGYGAEGMVYEIAISPNNEYLASGGWFGSDDETEDLGDIRLYDFESGKIEYVFKGLSNIPAEIKFLNDGKFLLAADQSSSIYVWEVKTRQLIHNYRYHSVNYGESLYELAADHQMIVSLDELGNIALWDINTENDSPVAVNTSSYKKVLKSINASMAISSTKEEIAISADNVIYFYDFKLKEKGKIELDFHPGFVEYNKTGDLLLHGNVGSGGDNYCSIWERQGKQWKFKYKLVGHSDAVLAGKFLSNNSFVTGGGSKDEVNIWNISAGGPELTHSLKGNGTTYHGVSVFENKLALASKWTAQYGFSKFDHVFDLFHKQFEAYTANIRTQRSYHKTNDFSLSTEDEGLGIQRNNKLFVTKNNNPYDTIVREWWFGDRHNCFSLLPSGLIVSGGAQGVMEAYNTEGFPVTNFVGHESDIWSIGFNKDTSFMITCAADQTIRIWDLSDVGKRANEYPPYTIEEYFKTMEIWEPFQKLFKQAKIIDLTSIKTFEAWNVAIQVFKKMDYPYQLLEKKYFDYQYNTIYPKISMYINDDGEWVIWNTAGYFTSSLKGARYVGFHMNQGQDKEAIFYPFEQFDLKYNRPDIILDELDMGFEEYIPLYKKAYEKRLQRMGYEMSDLNNNMIAPSLKIVESNRVENDLYVRIKGNDDQYNLSKLNVYNNDVPVYGRRGIQLSSSKRIDTLIKIELANGRNKITLNIENSSGTRSLNQYKQLMLSEQAQSSDLYLITLGVSEYADSSFNLRFAAKDAYDINNFLGSSDEYRKVRRLYLANHQVTKSSLDSIQDFVKEAGINDVVIIFIAGHGLLDKDYNYIYATHDIDFQNPHLNGISFTAIEDLLDMVKSHRKLLLMDTCHSGEVDEDDLSEIEESTVEMENINFRSVGSKNKSLKVLANKSASEMSKSLFLDLRKGTGTTVISSSGGVEFAFESSAWNNGLFTYCLINSIKNGKSDLNDDKSVSISELRETLREEVTKMSNGFQKPTMRLSNIETDFEIWRYAD